MAQSREDIINEIKEWFTNHEDDWDYCFGQLCYEMGMSWSDLYESMDNFNYYFKDKDPLDVVQKAIFGEDLDGSNGFNPKRKYFKFNRSGNLVSTDNNSYIEYLTNSNIEILCKKRHIFDMEIDREIDKLLDTLEKME